MELTYAQLTEALAQTHNASGNDGGAFRSRLRKLQSEGIPGGANPGKGKRVAYTVPLIIEAAIAVELLQIGWSPHQAAYLVGAYRQDMLAATLLSLLPNQPSNHDVLIAVSPEALGAQPVADRVGAISFVTREKVGELFRHGPSANNLAGRPWRWSLIDLAPATLITIRSVAVIGFPNEVFVQALREAIEEYDAVIRTFRQTKLNKILIEKDVVGTRDCGPS